MPRKWDSPILIVEDSNEDFEALVWALRRADRHYQNVRVANMLKRLDLDRFVREVEALTRYWFEVVMLPAGAEPA